MTLTIEPIGPGDRETIAGLLVSRHARDRRREPLLSARYESVVDSLEAVDALLAATALTGVIARQDGRPAGFLAGIVRTPSPLSFSAKWVAPRSAIVPYEGYALAEEGDAEIYRVLYAALAAGWVERGYFSHQIELAARDAIVADAFHSLGFGRKTTLAVRSTADPVAVSDLRDVEIRRASLEDLADVLRLSGLLAAHHASPPSFHPYLREPDRDVAHLMQEALVDPVSANFVAVREGAVLGMQIFRAPDPSPSLARPARAIYLWQGVVAPEARQGGIGHALLQEGMAWAQAAGYASCTLHFLAANLAGARFWQRNGFRPLTHTLTRQVDERIAWAHA